MIQQDKLDVEDLAVSYHMVFNRKEYYRIITAGFTHRDPMHLIMNMISLYNVGTFAESFFGHIEFLILYFGSMIIGKYFALQIRHANRDDYSFSIGASGAISGLLGAYFLVIIRYYGFAGMRMLGRPLVSLLLISAMPGVDGTSHFCCMAVGMVISYLFFLI